MKKEITIENSPIENFLVFEKGLLNNPRTFFPIFEMSFKGRSDIIWREYLDWQKSSGKMKDHNIRKIGDDILTWNFGDEHHAQKIDKLAPFSIEQYKVALNTVFSFMDDRPQYFKFRKMEGMFNPLKLLLYELL